MRGRSHHVAGMLAAFGLLWSGSPLPALGAFRVELAQISDAEFERSRPSRFNLSANGGSGLVQAVSPETLAPGEVAAGIHVMNFDRNPGDIDFFEYRLQVAVGLGRRTELFVQVAPWLRTTSVFQEPVTFPVPPLDLFVDVFPSSALRREPYFLLAPEVPFKTFNLANRTGIGAFSSSTGDNVFGLKVNLLSGDRNDPVGFGVRGYVEVPTETPRFNVGFPEWRELAGVSGKQDYGVEFLVSGRWRSAEVLANVGYKQVGDPDRGLRVQFVDSSQSSPDQFLVGQPVEMGLDLPNEVRVSAGLTLPAFRLGGYGWWFLAEFNYKRFVGNHTAVERLVHPAEVSLGMQTSLPGFTSISVGAAWQLLLNNAGRGMTRTTSLRTPDGSRGDINFGALVDPGLAAEVAEFLTDRGATFSEASSKVFSTNNDVFDAWRNVPVGPSMIRAEGGGNVLAFLTWRIGTLP